MQWLCAAKGEEESLVGTPSTAILVVNDREEKPRRPWPEALVASHIHLNRTTTLPTA